MSNCRTVREGDRMKADVRRDPEAMNESGLEENGGGTKWRF